VTGPWGVPADQWRARSARPGQPWVEPWRPGHRPCVLGTVSDPVSRTLLWACERRAPRSSKTPTARTRPSLGAWPSRPCSLRRTPSRVRIPGPSPLRSLYSVRDPRTIGPARARSSGRLQILLFIAAFSSGAHHNRILLSRL